MQNINKQLGNGSILHYNTQMQGRIQDFKLGGGANLKKLRRAVFFLRCGYNHAVKWLKNILTWIKARLNMFEPCYYQYMFVIGTSQGRIQTPRAFPQVKTTLGKARGVPDVYERTL
jgi:hypothetical protein